jgi:hypothetical protein
MRGGIGTAPVVLALLAFGCSREHYRRAADAETGDILGQKSCATPWQLPPDYSPYPSPQSRLAQTSDPDCPDLPPARPRLYSYILPEPVKPASHSIPHTASDVGPGLAQQERAPTAASGLPLLPIPESAWQALPRGCLTRMLEFESVRQEYRTTFGPDSDAPLRDASPRLSLEEVIRLALLNSREYQSQKETLYESSLALTLQRYDYQLKFTPTGNGTVVDYRHLRTNDTTVNTLGAASGLGVQKTLATGAALLARFANDVVLTFNGPHGFAADVNSELFFGLTQSVLQRDIRFEPLVQAERDVVYAARDFARFRKNFFFDRAFEYYALVRRYRQIEIDSQNYLSLVRAFKQAEAEERAGLQSRVQVEQIEQDMLEGRRSLTATCNGLDSGLDRFKISMGLPTETPLTLDLTELSDLNLRDEIQVAAERVSRARKRLQSQRDRENPDRGELLNSAIVLTDRLIDWLRLRERAGDSSPDRHMLELLVAKLRVDETRLSAERASQELERTRRSDPPAPPVLLFQRSADVVEAMNLFVTQQLELAATLGTHADAIAQQRQAAADVAKRISALRDRQEEVLKEAQVGQLAALVNEANQLLTELEAQVRTVDQWIETVVKPPEGVEPLEHTRMQVQQLVNDADRLTGAAAGELVEIEIDTDEAMITALVSRLDLMNDRGQAADERRAIKLAADDLRSMLNLRAEQILSTDHHHPSALSSDVSETHLGLTLDLPLNRRAQRNAYRRALFGFQAAIRDLTEREDTIKLSIRDELRDLALARTQYQISVASAALAAERVSSTRLQLALGFPGVAARDFLEAQDAYRRALGQVADNHIGYIIDRARFFRDSELMQLDDTGFWRELHQERLQPVPRADFPPGSGPPYGELPDFIWLSHEARATTCSEP